MSGPQQVFSPEKKYRRKKPEAMQELRRTHIVLGDSTSSDAAGTFLSTHELEFKAHALTPQNFGESCQRPSLAETGLACRRTNFVLGDERVTKDSMRSVTSDTFRPPPPPSSTSPERPKPPRVMQSLLSQIGLDAFCCCFCLLFVRIEHSLGLRGDFGRFLSMLGRKIMFECRRQTVFQRFSQRLDTISRELPLQ